MACTSRRDRSIGEISTGRLPDTLGRPQQKREFVNAQFSSREFTPASPVGYRGDEVRLFNGMDPLVGFWQLNAASI
jgi:hypothetical protein